MASKPTRISATYLNVFLTAAKELGHKVSPAWFRPALSVLINTSSATSTTIDLKDLEAIVSTVIKNTQDHRLTFEFGSRLTLNRHGFLGYAAGSARNLRETIEIESKYLGTQLGNTRVDLEIFDTFFNTNIYIDADPYRTPFYMEIVLASSQAALLGLGIPRKLLRFAYANLAYVKPDYAELYDKNLAFTLRYAQPKNGFTTNIAVLDLENPYFDPMLNEITMDRLALVSTHERCILTDVNHYIKSNLAATPTIEGAASALHLSSRTLKRRLAGYGENFSKLLTDCRLNTAVDLLQSTRLTIEEISQRVGYSHASSFVSAMNSPATKPLSRL